MQSSAMGTSCFHYYPMRYAGPKHKKRVWIFPSAFVVPFHNCNYGDSIELSAAAGVEHSCLSGRHRIRKQEVVHSVDKESEATFEVDEEKALRALNELDEELNSVLNKSAPQSKIRASSLPDTLRDQMKEEEVMLSEPSLAYGAVALFVFTIIYNIFFYAVIKPSIDIS